MKISLALDNYCTHGCWYCCDSITYKRKRDSFLDSIGVKEYLRLILKLTDGVTNYRINGGEPFENPYIKEVTERILSAGHKITFLSNLNHIENLNGVSSKEQIQFEASFHISKYSPKQIEKYLNDYFTKACAISHLINVIIVMTPEVISNRNLPLYVDWMRATGEVYDCRIEITYQELYTDKYPSGYTEEEKKYLRKLIDIDSFIKAGRELYLKGKECTYMVDNLDVHRNGTISRCSSGFPGYRESLSLTTMKVSEGCAPCRYDKCLCVLRGIIGSLEPRDLSLKEYCKTNNL